jgi:hypothetical protein
MEDAVLSLNRSIVSLVPRVLSLNQSIVSLINARENPGLPRDPDALYNAGFSAAVSSLPPGLRFRRAALMVADGP